MRAVADKSPNSISEFIVSDHASQELMRRGIAGDMVATLLSHPDQVLSAGPHRYVFQSIVERGQKDYLYRVFVDVERDPPEVVTTYRTSKIDRYWRP